MGVLAQLVIFIVDISNALGSYWQSLIRLIWKLNGTSDKVKRVLSGDDDGKPAHVLYNWMTLPFRVYATPDAFLCTHERFDTVDIIKQPNVHLLSLSNTTATFVELTDINAYDTKQFPILFIAQTQNTRRVINLPLKKFYELVDEIDISDREVVWMFHSVRCGSTAWAQVFNSLPGWAVISDSQAMYTTVAYCMDHKDVTSFAKTSQYETMAHAIIKMNIAKMPAKRKVFWKTTVHDDHMLPIIAKYFPQHKILFGYRNSLPSAISFYKAFASIPFMKNKDAHLSQNPFDMSPYSTVKSTRLFYTNGYDWLFCKRVIEDVRPQGTFEWYMFMWCAKVTIALEAQKLGAKIQPVKYEELICDADCTLEKVFSYLSLSQDFVVYAKKALEEDSQENTFFSRKRRARFADWIRSPKSVERCDKILSAFGFPPLGSEFIMEGTI